MQNIRAIRVEDFNKIKKIYETYFANQFEFPDFVRNYIAAFVVEDDGEVIVVGGVRTIAEAVMITNKDIPTVDRREAMISILTALSHMSKLDGHDQLHAFVQEDKWKRHLIRVGFRPTKGEALVIDLE